MHFNQRNNYDDKWFKNLTCLKCNEKAIYILAYCNPIISLCAEHAPRMSNGTAGYIELTIIRNEPLGLGLYEEPLRLRKAPKDKCIICRKQIEDKSQFAWQSIKNGDKNFMYPSVIPAIPIIEIEYWICKEGFGCADLDM